jgi:hypothetical protein
MATFAIVGGIRWNRRGSFPLEEFTASAGVRDYRVRWSSLDGKWIAESSFELHGNMTPWGPLGYYRNPEAAMQACAEVRKEGR